MATLPFPEPTPDPVPAAAPASQPQPTGGAAPAAAPAASDPYADFKDALPPGVDAKAFILETLQGRRTIEQQGGLDRFIHDQAIGIAPSLAQEFLATEEGQALYRKTILAQGKVEAGEEVSPEEKRLLDINDRAVKAEERAERAEQLAQQGNTVILRNEIRQGMETEFASALKEQPELSEFEDDIRERIGIEAKADPAVLQPGWVKQRALHYLGRYSEMTQKASGKISTRGRGAGQAGGATASPKDPTTLSRDEAAEYMAELLKGGS